MTQGQLGERIAEWLPGRWARQLVQTSEAGRRSWSVVELIVFAYVLGVPVTHLLALPPTAEPEYTLPRGAVAVADVMHGRDPDEQAMLVDALRERMRHALRRGEIGLTELGDVLGEFRQVALGLDQAADPGPSDDR